MEWQPIKTAPKDGTLFLAWEAHYPYANVARWFQGRVYWLAEELQLAYTGSWSGHPPTHWMPLPDPPASPVEGASIQCCKYHPAYAVDRPPPTGCFRCWKLWTYKLRLAGKAPKP